MTQEREILAAYSIIFDGLEFLGPADPAVTCSLLERLARDLPPAPRIADLGCGTGASALTLARSLPQARILALDSHPPFIRALEHKARELGLGAVICARTGDMADPPPLDGASGAFDLLWAESSIYSIGRKRALDLWRPLLKPGGWLVFSDVVWRLGPAARSAEAVEFWAGEYPDMATAGDVGRQLEDAGYRVREPVFCDGTAWSNYYDPLRERLATLARLEERSAALDEVMGSFAREIAVHDSAGDEVAVAFFQASRDPACD